MSKTILVLVLIVMGYFGVQWKVAWIRSITCQCQCQNPNKAVWDAFEQWRIKHELNTKNTNND